MLKYVAIVYCPTVADAGFYVTVVNRMPSETQDKNSLGVKLVKNPDFMLKSNFFPSSEEGGERPIRPSGSATDTCICNY